MNISSEDIENHRAESIWIHMANAHQDSDGSLRLNRDIRDWLTNHGVTDDNAVCHWWLVNVRPVGLRVWLKDGKLRLLFKLTWGGK